MEVKLRALGYSVRNAQGNGPVKLDLSPEEVETLARMEHARWNAERALAGWTLGGKNTERKVTPYLIPYDDLPKNIKEFDRRSTTTVNY